MHRHPGARAHLLAIVMLAAAIAPALAQTQYRWQDKDGRTVFGDNPPADARNVKPLAPASSQSTSPLDGLPYEVRRVAERFPVTLYTAAAACSPCDSARVLLRTRGVPFTERSIGTPADRTAFERLGAGDQVPLLQVGSQRSSGFEAGAWHGMLDLAGYPRESRLPVTWKAPAPRSLAEPADPSSPAAAGPAATSTTPVPTR
jgi:hypothetical protein